MKKHLLSFGLILSLFASSFASALDGQGTVDEIINCGTGASSGNSGSYWKQMVLFRLSDDNWFGILADHVAQNNTAGTFDYDSNIAVSMVMTAFTKGYPLDVRATYGTGTYCGIAVSLIWDGSGDYMKLRR